MKYVSIIFLFLFSLNCAGQVRPSLINDFTPSQRTTLVNLMQQYIDVTIIHHHCYFDVLTGDPDLDIHDDFNFLPYHRVYIQKMEDFFILEGYPEFVPLPGWDPDTPTPSEFRVVDSDCFSTSCTVNVGSGNPNNYCSTPTDWDPEENRPNYLNLPVQSGSNNDLCDHPFSPTEPGDEDDDGLSRQIETPYHNDVHADMGGNMFSFASPASPIFWNFHAYLDDIWREWECNCPQSTTANIDLHMRDNDFVMEEVRDRGEEPNIDQGTMQNSPDIWVRNQQDGFTNDTHEDPEYTGPSTPVYVYVRVRNRGCQPSTGSETISLHWAKGATSLDWPNFWNGSITTPAPMGDLISTQNVPVLDSLRSTIMEFQWIPPNPDDYNGFNGDPPLFCLLARQVSSNDPMTFTEGSDLEDNVRNNNNIVWKDVNVQNNVPLPTELVAFSGKKINDEIQLTWLTDSEINNKGFEIYRSSNTDSPSWRKIGWIDGNGSSNQQYTYRFDDLQPEYGINYYRLKQVDIDGKYEYSNIIAVENDNSNFDLKIFPNPSTRNFNVQIKNPLSKNMKIHINNNLGVKVWESDLILGESGWSEELEIIGNGIYIITVQVGNKVYNKRVVILEK